MCYIIQDKNYIIHTLYNILIIIRIGSGSVIDLNPES